MDSNHCRWNCNFCDQYITVVNQHPVTSDSISWPADIIIDGCKAVDAHPDFAGKPILPSKKACSNLISGYTDERFYSVGGYCIKIIRHWRVIDWCLYDVNNPSNGGLFTRDQLIYLRNKVAPTLENSTCSAKEACANDLTCDGPIELIGRATDDCTDATKLIWSYRVDLNNDGTFGASNPGNNASGTYPQVHIELNGRLLIHVQILQLVTNYLQLKIVKHRLQFVK